MFIVSQGLPLITVASRHLWIYHLPLWFWPQRLMTCGNLHTLSLRFVYGNVSLGSWVHFTLAWQPYFWFLILCSYEMTNSLPLWKKKERERLQESELLVLDVKVEKKEVLFTIYVLHKIQSGMLSSVLAQFCCRKQVSTSILYK